MTPVSFDDEVAANVKGYELRTIDDLRDILAETKIEFQRELDVKAASGVAWAEERLDCLVRLIPRARYVLWKRDENFITIAQTVESLRAEFPWLKHEKVTR